MILYIILFFSIWTLDEFFNKPFLASIMGNFSYEVIRSVIKTAVWVVPCVFLLKKYETVVSISSKNMFTNKVAWLKTIPIFLIFMAYLLIGAYISYGSIAIRDSFNTLDLIGKFLFVGITEEIVFRGWLLNAFIKKTGKLFAIAISTLLFLFIHFPVWIHSRTFISAITSGAFLIDFNQRKFALQKDEIMYVESLGRKKEVITWFDGMKKKLILVVNIKKFISIKQEFS